MKGKIHDMMVKVGAVMLLTVGIFVLIVELADIEFMVGSEVMVNLLSYGFYMWFFGGFVTLFVGLALGACSEINQDFSQLQKIPALERRIDELEKERKRK